MPSFSPQQTLHVLRSDQSGQQDRLAAVEGVSPITDEVVEAVLEQPSIVGRLAQRTALTPAQRQVIAQWAIRRLAQDIDHFTPHPGAWALQEMHRASGWKPDADTRQTLIKELIRVDGQDPVLKHFMQHLQGLAGLFSVEELRAVLQSHPNMNALARVLAARDESLPDSLLETLAELGKKTGDRRLLQQLASRNKARQHRRVRHVLLDSGAPNILIQVLPAASQQEGRQALKKLPGNKARQMISLLEEQKVAKLEGKMLGPLLQLEDSQLRQRVLRLVGRRQRRR